MQFKKLLQWNRRFSLLYAAGVWTVIGSFGYSWYTGRFKERNVELIEEVPVDQNQVEFNTAHSRTVILYKKDFVPYTTRIKDFVRSFSGAASSQHAATPQPDEGTATWRVHEDDGAPLPPSSSG